MKKLLVTGSFPLVESQRIELANLGYDVVFHKDEREPVSAPEQFEAVVCNSLFLYAPIEMFSSLKVIQITSAGFDRIPLDIIQNRGIKLYNAKGVYSIPMAEFAVCGVLQLLKESAFFRKNQALHKWEKHRDLLELMGRTVCIVGCGSIGSECAKRFKAFGCEVIGVDMYPYRNVLYDAILPLTEIYDCFSKSDVILLALPLTEDTRHLIDEKAFSSMKNGAILVNIARGGVVDTAALITALDKKLTGAVLDVFEQEPLEPESLLWSMKNVLITPHNSFVSDRNGERLWQVIRANLSEYINPGTERT